MSRLAWQVVARCAHASRGTRLLAAAALLAAAPVVLHAQQLYPKSPTPLSGKYPGGHTGLRGGSSPAVGFNVFEFFRIADYGDLRDSQGQSIGPTNTDQLSFITGTTWNTGLKVLGMQWGGLAAIPIAAHYNRPNDTTEIGSGYGIGDIVVAPLIFYGVAKHFDYQVGAGYWFANGSFTPGATDNHGSGFSEILYTIGGAWYPTNHVGYSVSAVARFEQPFKQKDTEIQPGSTIVVDVGVASPYIPLDKRHNKLLMVGIAGFGTTQLSLESGVNAAESVSPYRVFALGPEVNYFIHSANLKLLARLQWEFGARNTTQGANYWFSISKHFGKKKGAHVNGAREPVPGVPSPETTK